METVDPHLPSLTSDCSIKVSLRCNEAEATHATARDQPAARKAMINQQLSSEIMSELHQAPTVSTVLNLLVVLPSSSNLSKCFTSLA